MEKQWIDNLRRQAGDYKHKSPDGLLDDIKHEMSLRGLMPSKPRMTVIWGRRIAVAAAVLLALIFLVKNISDGDDPTVASMYNKDTKPVASHTVAAANTTIAQPSLIRHRIEEVIGGIKTDGHSLMALMTGDAPANADGDKVVAETSQAVEDTPSSTLENKDRNHRPDASNSNGNRQLLWSGNSSRIAAAGRNHHSGLSLAVNYSGMAGSSGVSGVNGALVYASDALENSYNLGNMPKAVTDMTTSSHHNMPVKVGVSLRYSTGSRWSIQTGVNYSYLSSNITRSNNIEEYASKQKLHYVSIPLTASYSVWKSKRVNVYLSAGGEAAKLVSGKADVTHTVYGESTASSNDNVSEHRLQYSVGAAAGIEYNVGGRLQVFAEPGVTRYFDNHSGVTNIYKDKPTQFTINLGVRLNLNE